MTEVLEMSVHTLCGGFVSSCIKCWIYQFMLWVAFLSVQALCGFFVSSCIKCWRYQFMHWVFFFSSCLKCSRCQFIHCMGFFVCSSWMHGSCQFMPNVLGLSGHSFFSGFVRWVCGIRSSIMWGGVVVLGQWFSCILAGPMESVQACAF